MPRLTTSEPAACRGLLHSHRIGGTAPVRSRVPHERSALPCCLSAESLSVSREWSRHGLTPPSGPRAQPGAQPAPPRVGGSSGRGTATSLPAPGPRSRPEASTRPTPGSPVPRAGGHSVH